MEGLKKRSEYFTSLREKGNRPYEGVIEKLKELTDTLQNMEEEQKRVKGEVKHLKELVISCDLSKTSLYKAQLAEKECEYSALEEQIKVKKEQVKCERENVEKCATFHVFALGEIIAAYLTKLSGKKYVLIEAIQFVLDDYTSENIRYKYRYSCIRKKRKVIVILADQRQSEPYIRYVDDEMIRKEEKDGYLSMRDKEIIRKYTFDKFEDMKKSGAICDFYPYYLDDMYTQEYCVINSLGSKDYMIKINERINVYSDEIKALLVYIILARYERGMIVAGKEDLLELFEEFMAQ
ncbi:MAG: hypothetical protein Q4D02_07325 [Clostridia bacterium]|nr:hypothetical protein [Clostridia bacterium]